MALPASDAHKVARVLRLTTGDSIRIVDSSGTEYDAELDVRGDVVVAHLHDVVGRPDEPCVELTLAQGMPKGQKMDFIVEKASELGVIAIVPFTSERAVVREASGGKPERWRRIAKSAAQQSGRRTVLDVRDPVDLAALTGRFADYDTVIVPWESTAPAPLRETLPTLLANARSVLAIVGPEGGFSHAEAALLQQAGGNLVSLGRRILRTETAGLYIAAIVDFLTST